jgi:hypothetical protein
MTWIPGGYNNWFSISLDDSSFQLKFNRRATTLYQDFEAAADHAVNLLYQQWNDRPLYLAMSGGMDSEFVANALYRNQIPFQPVILHIDDRNQTESWYAHYWCKQHNVQPIVLTRTMPQILEALAKFFPKLMEIKQVHQTPMLVIYDWVTQQDGYCIYGGGDINLSEKKFYCNSLDFISSIIYQDRHPTSFFMYTAELALCYISKFDIDLDEQYNKLSFYNVMPRPKIEYLAPMIANTDYQTQLEKLYYVCKFTDTFDPYYWYGTKQQIMDELQP